MGKPTGIVTILLFAQAKELLNRSSVQIELLLPATTAEIKTCLARDFPDIESLVAISRLAVNRTFVADDFAVEGSEEIAIIPPVSGG